MAYDMFRGYGLDKIHDSYTDDYDYKDNNVDQWSLVKKKEVRDSDGFMTEYAWWTNGDKHIFMFGDTDLYDPDEDYADWVAETEEEASSWFDNYNGFESDDDTYFDAEDEFDDEPIGNSDFLNDGFERVYGEGLDLED